MYSIKLWAVQFLSGQPYMPLQDTGNLYTYILYQNFHNAIVWWISCTFKVLVWISLQQRLYVRNSLVAAGVWFVRYPSSTGPCLVRDTGLLTLTLTLNLTVFLPLNMDEGYISQTMKLGALGIPAYRTFSLEELEVATNKFASSAFMGEGSQGQVCVTIFRTISSFLFLDNKNYR